MLVNAYALSGAILLVFNQAFARDRPNNGATTIINNAIRNAICISLLSPRGLTPLGNGNDAYSFVLLLFF
jgi:hypothetical protein